MTLAKGSATQTKAPSPGPKTGGTPANQQAAAILTGSTTISGAIPAGTNVIGHVIIDTGSTTAVTGNVTVIQGTGSNLHTVIDSGTITANPTSSTPIIANALSTTVKAVVSSLAATLDSVTIMNPNTTLAYVQVFDVATAGAVTLGTTVPKWSIGLNQTSQIVLSDLNLHFANGIQVAATTTATGSTALVTAVDANFGYH